MNKTIKRSASTALQVALYLRMSSDQQDTSIAQQRKECRRHAAEKGWVIVAEYLDEGKSGSRNQSKRLGFLQLIADSSEGNFTAILCYDTSRFSRLDSLNVAETKKILRDNGIVLETVREGRIDWSTSMGRMADAMLAEGNHMFAVKISETSLRGRASKLADGFWPFGRVPLGFDREYYENGVVKYTNKRTELFRKPMSWRLKLKINEDEAKIVRMAFEKYASSDISLRGLTRWMSEQGTTSPRGKQPGWSIRSMDEILKNPVYAGDISMGGRRTGGTKGTHNQAEAVINSGAVPAIVSREIWNTCQKKLVERQKYRRSVRSTSFRGSGPLSGILICGHCGFRMCRKTLSTGKIIYRCTSPIIRPSSGCKGWRVVEAEILPEICKVVVGAVDWQMIQAIQAAPAPEDDRGRELLQQRADELRQQIKRASENLLVAHASVFSMLQDGLMKLQTELMKVENALDLAGRSNKPDDMERYIKWWRSVRDQLVVVAPEICDWSEVKSVVQKQQPRFTHADLASNRKLALGIMDPEDFTKQPPADLAVQLPKLVRPPLIANAADLRALLLRLGLQVTLRWVKDGKRRYSLDKGVLRANFAETFTEQDLTTGCHKGLTAIEVVISFSKPAVQV